MKELIDDLRAIQVDHVQIEKASHKLSIFRTELGRKLVLRDQLLVRSEVSPPLFILSLSSFLV